MNRKKFVIIFLCVIGFLGIIFGWSMGQPQKQKSGQGTLTKINRVMEEEDASGNGGDTLVVASPRELPTKYSLELKTEGKDDMILADICEGSTQPDVMEAKAAIMHRQVDFLITNRDMDEYMTSIDCSIVKRIDAYHIYRINYNFYDSVTDEKKIQDITEQVGLSFYDVEIPISDDIDSPSQVLGTYVLLNDLHVLLTTDDTTAEHKDTINQRYSNMALTGKGVHSADTWQGISALVDAMKVDGLLLAGDMIDFGSTTNFDIFQKGLDKISTPIMYARSDHDMSTWYNSDKSYTKKDAKKAQMSLHGADNNLTPMEDIMVWDKEEYFMVAWNNSTSQLSKTGLAKARKVFEMGKPIILITHVPINSTVDDGLLRAAKDFDPEHRAKLWGQGCLYEPNEVTQEFLDMVVEEDSPVRSVLSGHLHFAYETRLNDHCMEYVFSPTFSGNMTRVTIVR